MPLVWILNLVFCIIAGIKANEGVSYRYPFALRLIKYAPAGAPLAT
jgi:uncharacterized Tic20 family protein